MATIKTVTDITADVALATSKPKIVTNFDDLYDNDIALNNSVGVLEGGSFVGSSRWDDIVIPPGALGGGASSPDLITLVSNISAYAFDGGGTLEQLYGSFEIPHDYKEGTDLRPHIHWTPTTAGAGNVVWNLEYSLAARSGTFGASTTVTATDAAAGALIHNAEEFTSISGSGITIGTVIMFRLYRDPTNVADTYGADAVLLSLGVHYEVDATGSTNIFTK